MLIYKYNGFGKLSLEKLRAFIRPICRGELTDDD